MSKKKKQKVHQRPDKIKKTRKDSAHIRRIQRHPEHLEHQISEEKDAHPKEKMKEAKSSHQEKELPISLVNSVANCMQTTNVKKQSWNIDKNEMENDKGDQSAGVQETNEIPEFTKEELQVAIDKLNKGKAGEQETPTESEPKTSKHATKRQKKW